MLAIVGLPWLLWRLGRTERWAPLVVVQIGTGILLGPGMFGAAFPALHAEVFTPAVIGMLGGIAQWAVMLFVWAAGIELNLREAWDRRAETALVAGFALLMPLAAGCMAGAALLASGAGWMGPAGARWQVVLGIGMACTVTALPILVLFLERLDVLRTPFGQRVLRYASLDDVAIWGVLALVLLDWARVERQAGFLLLFAGAAVMVRRWLPRLAERDRWAVGLIWLAASGFAADWAGLHFMVGAFLAGAVLDADWFGRESLDRFRDTVLLALMPVFFLSTGLRTSWSVGGVAVFGAAALLLAASVLGKLAGVGLAGRLLRWRLGEAGVIGLLLQTKALIMIIFSTILLDRQVITADTFTALMLMALASTALTVPLVRPRLARLQAASATDMVSAIVPPPSTRSPA